MVDCARVNNSCSKWHSLLKATTVVLGGIVWWSWQPPHNVACKVYVIAAAKASYKKRTCPQLDWTFLDAGIQEKQIYIVTEATGRTSTRSMRCQETVCDYVLTYCSLKWQLKKHLAREGISSCVVFALYIQSCPIWIKLRILKGNALQFFFTYSLVWTSYTNC